MTIKLGDKARDTITGFTGIVVCRSEWQYGCIRFTLQPMELHDGAPIATHTFDEPQLELVQPESNKDWPPRHGPRPEPERR